MRVIIHKGGAGSGNWGHMGRPGKVGGSMPLSSGMSLRTGSTAELRKRATKNLAKYKAEYSTLGWDLDMKQGRYAGRVGSGDDPYIYRSFDLFRELKPEMTCTWQEFVHNAYEFADEESGLHSEVRKVRSDGRGFVSIDGGVYDTNGNRVGTFERHISISSSDGKPILKVNNEMFSINDDVQGKGFGAKFYEQAEKVYMGQGVDVITVGANINVGGYAWAKMGFDFADSNALRDMQVDAKGTWRLWARNAGDKNPPAFKMPTHSWELAAMTSPWDDKWGGGMSFGKKFLMGKSWLGIKYLNPDSASAKVGSVYYEVKKGKKK